MDTDHVNEMKIGVIFPSTQMETDAGAIRAYAEGVAALGYSHILAYDHVLAADRTMHAKWDHLYDVDSRFREPMVLFGYLAAVTDLELVTGVLIAPQRQTVLLAKQAAEVDLLCQGNFRLGLGLGWNHLEYEALGQRFNVRGARLEAQIQLMRTLWTERSVSFRGEFDQVNGAGISPRPIQRPIPIWVGAQSPVGLKRAGRLACGWFPLVPPGADLDTAKAVVSESALSVGRDPASIGMEGRVFWTGDAERLVSEVSAWKETGATHVAIRTADAAHLRTDGFRPTSVFHHLLALKHAADALRLAGGD